FLNLQILQNLGKVDRTADEIFDEHLQNFTKQQNAANRLQKEFSNYIRCIRATQAASKTLLEAIGEVYESQWTGHDQLYIVIQSVDVLWQDFSHKLADQVLLPLNTYQSQFPEMRKKIDKRERKLVDYDSQRHSFQALQTNMKKRDDVKVGKGREQLEEAKRTYEILNSELHDELPALFDSRVLFQVTNLQTLFNAEHTFHSQSSKIFIELADIADKLATDSQRGSYSVKKTNGTNSLLRPKSLLKDSPELILNNLPPSREASTEHLPPGVLYRVKATYKYTREDVDELSFDVGEIVSVVEYDDPDEQEEGWLMGMKENGEKGMFPANFTRPL
uniref:Endophilin-A n=1 Tax=Dendroctonus ponderosae TaxID=77166 RepID=A0AAR5P7K6_DENPD